MGFFSLNDPATASLAQDPVLAELADQEELPTRATRKKNQIKRCNSMDPADATDPQAGRRGSRRAKKPIRRVRSTDGSSSLRGSVGSSTNSGMQEHLEDIEAFCQVMKEAGSEKREKMLRKSLRRQSGK